MEILKCDICGRTSMEASHIDNYKMKKLTHSWHESWWERLDICSDCIDEIRRRVRNGGKE